MVFKNDLQFQLFETYIYNISVSCPHFYSRFLSALPDMFPMVHWRNKISEVGTWPKFQDYWTIKSGFEPRSSKSSSMTQVLLIAVKAIYTMGSYSAHSRNIPKNSCYFHISSSFGIKIMVSFLNLKKEFILEAGKSILNSTLLLHS